MRFLARTRQGLMSAMNTFEPQIRSNTLAKGLRQFDCQSHLLSLDALDRLKNPNLLLLRIVTRYRPNYRTISRNTMFELASSSFCNSPYLTFAIHIVQNMSFLISLKCFFKYLSFCNHLFIKIIY